MVDGVVESGDLIMTFDIRGLWKSGTGWVASEDEEMEDPRAALLDVELDGFFPASPPGAEAPPPNFDDSDSKLMSSPSRIEPVCELPRRGGPGGRLGRATGGDAVEMHGRSGREIGR